KDTLTMFMVERIGPSISPEPYLNMNAAGSKGLMTTLKTEAELQEYVGAEEHHPIQKQPQQQDYYETFQGVESTNNVTPTIYETDDNVQTKEEEIENKLIDIYACFSAAQTKTKCQICGPLYRKEGKRLFVFEQCRACWVGLIGSHLLIYGNDRDSRPCTILPLQGYMARAAPNAVPRDQRRSESTFEIFRPGSKTFQFSAKTPKDMEQWVSKICNLCGEKKNDCKEFTKEMDNVVATSTTKQTNDQEDSISKEERYQDVRMLGGDDFSNKLSIVPNIINEDTERKADDSPAKDTSCEIADTSLPYPSIVLFETVTVSSQSHSPLPPPLPARIPRRLLTLPAQSPNSIDSRNALTYDDTANSMLKDNKITDEQNKFVSYDDIESIASNLKSAKIRLMDKTDESAKSPQKKSFLQRVRSKKESPKKIEKKANCKILNSPLQQSSSSLSTSVNNEKLPIYYDDVSDLMNVQQETIRLEEEQSDYTCPPPPRPIYAKPPLVNEVIDTEEFYDDITYRDKYKDDREISTKLYSKITRKPNISCENTNDTQQSFEDNIEHYKTPRLESRYPKYLHNDQQVDDLYDDIAILAEFTARQKEVLNNKDNEGITRSQLSPEKRSWNRFVGGKKSKTIDPTVNETNNRILNGTEDVLDDIGEQHSSLRMNTFQKLISRMENSLSKASARTASSMLLNK
ncbi:Src kinase-associated phosphoprotein 2-B, partial [Eufriesea mexicana]